jgi:hypothetical protein
MFTTEQRLTTVRDDAGAVVAIESIGRPVAGSRRQGRVQAGAVVLDLAGHRALVGDRVVDSRPPSTGYSRRSSRPTAR